MSADLLEAFGQYSISNQASDESRQIEVSTSSPASIAVKPRVSDTIQDPLWKKDTSGTDVLFDAADGVDDGGDDFGEFEDAEIEPQQQQQQQHTRTAIVNADAVTLLDLDLETSPVTTVRPATKSSTGVHVPGAYDSDPFGSILDSEDVTITKPQQKHLGSYDEETEDDWGTFEDAEAISPIMETRTEISSQNVQSPVPPKNGAIKEDDWAISVDEPTTKQSPLTQPKVSPQTLHVASDEEEEDDWDAFEDGPAPELLPTTKTSTSQSPRDMRRPVSKTMTKSTPIKRSERPTNVPPPSILLELLPKIYQNLATESRSASTSHENDEITTAAHHILRIFLTTARVLAGRPHRWKRDPHLSQSMRISAAGSKGMKLQTLDRSHVVKEDQDAIEAITAWSRYAHAFNSTLLKAKISRPTASTNLSGNMPVRTVNGPGVLTAKEVCAVCGLKRNERIVGIDAGVEDVFGEFWVEFWGHRDCCTFWEEAESMLERR